MPALADYNDRYGSEGYRREVAFAGFSMGRSIPQLQHWGQMYNTNQTLFRLLVPRLSRASALLPVPCQPVSVLYRGATSSKYILYSRSGG